MYSCINNASRNFSNNNYNSSYASDYISRKKLQSKDLRNPVKSMNRTDLSYSLISTKNFQDINNVCRVGPEIDNIVTCISPTKIDSSLKPFYFYYKISKY